MTTISLTPQVLFVIALMALMLVMLAIVMLPDVVSETWLARAYQSFRFRKSRMGQILAREGAGLRKFTSKLSVAEMKKLSDGCRTCLYAEHCDEVRQHARLRYADLVFCPNRQVLTSVLNH